ncbi:MAG: glycosyltransferase [Arenicellales bacterium]
MTECLARGGFVVVGDPSTPEEESFDWECDVKERAARHVTNEKVLVFPSLASPELLIREAFLQEQKGAWRHIAKYLDESGRSRTAGLSPEESVWQTFERHQDLPLSNVDRYQIFYETSQHEESPLAADFLHSSIGDRKQQFWTQTVKPRGEGFVRRCKAPLDLVDSSGVNVENELGIAHLCESEAYRPGETLSERMLKALQSGSRPDITFGQLAQQYYLFLSEQLNGRSVKLIDLLPDNIVVEGQDTLDTIDQEWTTTDPIFNADIAFIRGLVYFLSRNTLALDRLVQARYFGPTHGDFLRGIISGVIKSTDRLIHQLVQFEDGFRKATLDRFGIVGIPTMLNRRFGDHETVKVDVRLGFGPNSGDHQISIPFSASSAGYRADCQLVIPVTGLPPTELTILFDPPVGEVRLHSLRLHLTDGSNGVDLLDLSGHRRVSESASRIEMAGDGLIDIATEPSVTRLMCFALSQGRVLSGRLGKVVLDLVFSWPELGFRISDRPARMSRLWQREAALAQVESQLQVSRQELARRTAELELLKSSKAWRLAEILRRIVYNGVLLRVVHKPEPKAAIEMLQAESATPTERLSTLVAQSSAIPSAAEAIVASEPLISVILPVHNTPKSWLADAVGSVRNQSYPHWQLVIVNDGSKLLETREFLDKLDDPQITVIPLTRSCGISGATCVGIESAHGEFIAFLDHDDMLAPEALKSVVEVIQRDTPDILYTDETAFSDSTDKKIQGYFGTPHLKPDFSPDLLLSHNYITHLLVVRKSLIDSVGGPRSSFDGAQDYDFILRLSEQTDKIAHIAQPLYHWRQSHQSTSLDTGVKPEAHTRGGEALREVLGRRGIEGEVLMANAPHFFRVRREIKKHPLVSVIIPFRDEPRLLQQSISAILERTRYSNFQILGVDNGSVDELTLEIKDRLETMSNRVSFVSFDKPFNFSELVNFGVSQAKGEHVVLFNNDIEVINVDWLTSMLEHSQRPEIGAVGGKLYYPDDTIQHAGIIVGIGGYAGHSHKHKPGGDRGYLNRLNVIQNVSAVTGALLMCEKSTFTEIGGFDPVNFGVACNDVDFCLRLIESGYRNVFTPYALAYHFESVSRGYEDTPEKKTRFEREVDAFRKRHAQILKEGDPYYNPNLRLDVEDFSIRPLDND